MKVTIMFSVHFKSNAAIFSLSQILMYSSVKQNQNIEMRAALLNSKNKNDKQIKDLAFWTKCISPATFHARDSGRDEGKGQSCSCFYQTFKTLFFQSLMQYCKMSLSEYMLWTTLGYYHHKLQLVISKTVGTERSFSSAGEDAEDEEGVIYSWKCAFLWARERHACQEGYTFTIFHYCLFVCVCNNIYAGLISVPVSQLDTCLSFKSGRSFCTHKPVMLCVTTSIVSVKSCFLTWTLAKYEKERQGALRLSFIEKKKA